MNTAKDTLPSSAPPMVAAASDTVAMTSTNHRFLPKTSKLLPRLKLMKPTIVIGTAAT